MKKRRPFDPFDKLRAMSKHRKTKHPGRGNKLRFPGICAAARALGRSRIHLYLVLTGERKSPGLMARYRKLKGSARLRPEATPRRSQNVIGGQK